MPYIMQNAIPGTPDVDEFGEPYTNPTFDVTNGEFGQRWLKIPNASPSLHAMFRRMLGSSYITDPDYEMRIACGAEWRTGGDRRSGFIIITINPNYTQQFSDWCKSRWLGLTTASWFTEAVECRKQ